MAHHTRKSSALHLGHGDDTRVVITPEDMDKFVSTVSKVVSACVNHAQFEAFERTMQDRFRALCKFVAEWCAARPTVDRALFDRRDGGTFFLLLVVRSDAPDAGLGDDVSEFDMHLYRDFPEYPMSVMTVPASRSGAASAFVDPDEALLIYAGTQRSPGNR